MTSAMTRHGFFAQIRNYMNTAWLTEHVGEK
jgi:hypothetical protein